MSTTTLLCCFPVVKSPGPRTKFANRPRSIETGACRKEGTRKQTERWPASDDEFEHHEITLETFLLQCFAFEKRRLEDISRNNDEKKDSLLPSTGECTKENNSEQVESCNSEVTQSDSTCSSQSDTQLANTGEDEDCLVETQEKQRGGKSSDETGTNINSETINEKDAIDEQKSVPNSETNNEVGGKCLHFGHQVKEQNIEDNSNKTMRHSEHHEQASHNETGSVVKSVECAEERKRQEQILARKQDAERRRKKALEEWQRSVEQWDEQQKREEREEEIKFAAREAARKKRAKPPVVTGQVRGEKTNTIPKRSKKESEQKQPEPDPPANLYEKKNLPDSEQKKNQNHQNHQIPYEQAPRAPTDLRSNPAPPGYSHPQSNTYFPPGQYGSSQYHTGSFVGHTHAWRPAESQQMNQEEMSDQRRTASVSGAAGNWPHGSNAQQWQQQMPEQHWAQQPWQHNHHFHHYQPPGAFPFANYGSSSQNANGIWTGVNVTYPPNIPPCPAGAQTTGQCHQPNSTVHDNHSHTSPSPPLSGCNREHMKASGDGCTGDLKRSLLTSWALEPPSFGILRPIDSLLATIHAAFPPAFGVESHTYFSKWTPVTRDSLISENTNLIDELKLKKAVRKVRFFLHPDRLPKDFDEKQAFVCKLLWDVTSDAWESHTTAKDELDWALK